MATHLFCVLVRLDILPVFRNTFLTTISQLFARHPSFISRTAQNINVFRLISINISVMMAVVPVPVKKWMKMRCAALIVKLWMRQMKKMR
jgi:hypothetical protein